MRSARRVGLSGVIVTLLSALMLSGCGSGRSVASGPSSPTARRESTDIGVIRGWASALARGDLETAASYFARPSLFINGVVVVIHSRHDALVANASLSCGARLIAARPHGRYILATFRLTNRPGPGADCGSGTGQTGSTDFLIRHGRIVEWVRAPDGAGTGGASPGSGGATPGGSGSPGGTATTPAPATTGPSQQV